MTSGLHSEGEGKEEKKQKKCKRCAWGEMHFGACRVARERDMKSAESSRGKRYIVR